MLDQSRTGPLGGAIAPSLTDLARRAPQTPESGRKNGPSGRTKEWMKLKKSPEIRLDSAPAHIIPIETVAPLAPTSRDFVPWRFSDACRPARRCIRHPGVRETCTLLGDARVGHHSISSSVRGSPGSFTGTQATIVVPWPGLLSMSILPPSKTALCRMLARPRLIPARCCLGSKPAPLS